MTTAFKIDISKNELSGFKALKAFAVLFIIFFIATGVFSFVRAYQKGSDWMGYVTSLTPFCIAVIVYLQATGKWIYKKFLEINNDNIRWTRFKLFGTTTISWTKVQSVNFEYTSINFKLIDGRTQRFDLININRDQIKELKDILRDASLAKHIEFVSK